jgi:hypothetical protein
VAFKQRCIKVLLPHLLGFYQPDKPLPYICHPLPRLAYVVNAVEQAGNVRVKVTGKPLYHVEHKGSNS